jgi:hypothetical protein
MHEGEFMSRAITRKQKGAFVWLSRGKKLAEMALPARDLLRGTHCPERAEGEQAQILT